MKIGFKHASASMLKTSKKYQIYNNNNNNNNNNKNSLDITPLQNKSDIDPTITFREWNTRKGWTERYTRSFASIKTKHLIN